MFNKEFEIICEDISLNTKFMELSKCDHHGITRLEHSYRVAYMTYKVLKFLKLNYVEGTRAALLHDFFTDEVDDMWALARYRNHPKYALENAKKYYKLSKMQEDIILKHMFPFTLTPPKYIESVLVDIIDDICSIYDKVYSVSTKFGYSCILVFSIFSNYIRFK